MAHSRAKRVARSLVAVVALGGLGVAVNVAAATTPPRCAATDVSVIHYGTTVAAGTVGELFWIAAAGPHACTVRGWVSVAFTGTYGTAPSRRPPVALAVAETNHRRYPPVAGVSRGRPLPTVTVSPGGDMASFWIFGTDEPHVEQNGSTARCVVSSDMSLRLPGGAGTVTVVARADSFDWCGGVAIFPVVPGDTGSDPAYPLRQVIAPTP